MKNTGNSRLTFSHRVFFKTFILLSLVSVLPLICISLLFSNLSEQFWKSESYSASQRALNQYINNIDNQIMSIREEMQGIVTDSSVISFILKPTFAEIARNTQIMKSLNDIQKSDNGIHYAYLYSNFAGLILSSENKGYRYIHFYDKPALDLYSDKQYGSMIFRHNSDASLTIPDLEDCVTFYENIPLNSRGNLGCLILNMDRNYLFTSNLPDSALEMSIYDSDFSSLFTQNPAHNTWQQSDSFRQALNENSGTFIYKSDPEDLVVLHAVSPLTGWTYIGTSSMPDFFTQYRHISRLLMTMAAVALSFSFLLSYLAAKRLYKPLRGLVSLMGSPDEDADGDGTYSDEYQYIHHAYRSIKEDNQNMISTINKLRPAVKENFFFSLLLGEPLTEEEINAKLAFIGENFTASCYGVIMLLLSDYEQYIQTFSEQDQLLFSCQVSEAVSEAAGLLPHTFLHMNRISWALIINSPVSDNAALLQVASSLEKSLKQLSFPVLIGTGNIYESPADLSYSFREAQEMLKFQRYSFSDNASEAEKEPERPVYYLNTKLEEMLLQAIRTGSPSAVEEPCMDIYQNMRQYSASYNDVSLTASHIMNQILEILISLDIDVDSYPELGVFYKSLKDCHTIGDIQMLLKNTAFIAASCVESFNRQNSGKNIERLKEYVRTHLGEDISLQDLADICQMSPSYVSRLFKKHLNMGFVEYISTLRINRAKKLLEDTQMTVEQVGFQVGFNNVRSFMRLFKQYEGTSPGQYRSQAANSRASEKEPEV